ncbi:8-amino-7-oxononanoate synthase [Sphingosinicella sp. LHD-64]|uniref:8-amino-7-oxononanoate synthase n=1 Tax=Sphingosinicella sp. LHD-64 TaxID=3072139 RepID=UPI00280CF0D3|nr:8-amino-7-oxononanoate synthase [Sphingosinicella sp. LHD-64]MDQ8756490.1 8-amino-7-oxononanoate synthase [Sphingosinicella sp. LHD-64]
MERMDIFAGQLAALGEAGRLRSLAPRLGRDFSSNDYLGLAGDPDIARAVAEAVVRGVPAGSGGSRLLRGNHPEHEALEDKAARFFGSETALYFSSGFAANMALFATLPQSGDLVVADELVHASAHEGLRRSRAEHRFASHNDADAFADIVAEWRSAGGRGRVWLAFETVYSMEGDVGPIDDLAAIARAEDGWLLIDEAHATGVFGPGGRGLAAHLDGAGNVVSLHTCGKGLGVEGALVCAPRIIVDFLVNRARSFIFSTAPSPLMAVAAGAALDRCARGDDLRARLDALRDHAGALLGARFGLPAPASQIIPFVLGDERRAMAAAGALRAAGFDVRGIRPPTVPDDTSRLRISLTLNVGTHDVDDLAEALAAVLECVPA